jgi:hypothetical protein
VIVEGVQKVRPGVKAKVEMVKVEDPAAAAAPPPPSVDAAKRASEG